MSLKFRYRVAAKQLTQILGVVTYATPVKFAFAIANSLPIHPLRYFRDLDFHMEEESLQPLVEALATLSIYPGDIDSCDWHRYLISTVAEGTRIGKGGEAHFFRVTAIRAADLQAAYESTIHISTLPEHQFYGFVGDQFVTRSFYDFKVGNELGLPSSDPHPSYVDSLLEDLAGDLLNGRVGLNQVLELEHQFRLLSWKQQEDRSEQVESIIAIESRESVDLKPVVLLALDSYVAEIVDRVTVGCK